MLHIITTVRPSINFCRKSVVKFAILRIIRYICRLKTFVSNDFTHAYCEESHR